MLKAPSNNSETQNKCKQMKRSKRLSASWRSRSFEGREVLTETKRVKFVTSTLDMALSASATDALEGCKETGTSHYADHEWINICICYS